MYDTNERVGLVVPILSDGTEYICTQIKAIYFKIERRSPMNK